jgi:hypothetical protein
MLHACSPELPAPLPALPARLHKNRWPSTGAPLGAPPPRLSSQACTLLATTHLTTPHLPAPLPLQVAINGERPWVDPDCPEPLRRLITKCWHQDPHMRPSCAEVMRLTSIMIQVGGCVDRPQELTTPVYTHCWKVGKGLKQR